MIKLTTNHGDILLTLDEKRAPVTCANFIQYVRDGHYDGTIFHRVIDGFMIQGGGMTPDLQAKQPRAAIDNEAKNGLKNVVGAIAMARTTDPHSATAQFYINVANNGFLDYPGQDGWGYCVFGQVTEGMEVVNAIKAVATGTRQGHQDVPMTDVVIEKAEIVADPSE
ncbi:peptidyl-prolyl cis-trans isomerase [Rhodoferax sp. 4810]|uniref:Peptidyl-prolyl cis-trans isomerase n=1 Tax=Thiospirillum jenense TaxID=1653858 RepID=A0A839HCM5_9GAMM|nr:peptidylprolyl isomerase [Thiospirillum jenense]MBB1076315.1 peptidyl-prolyl cis-trans isomerase [Rhodoferax jenense]MBB1126274.1 peptidyl-prolyl cis-trans isomerase [Thiospirillum jenense]